MKAILAMAKNRVIGKNGGLPWHVPNDFKWFKEFTMGKKIIVGKNTIFVELDSIIFKSFVIDSNK